MPGRVDGYTGTTAPPSLTCSAARLSTIGYRVCIDRIVTCSPGPLQQYRFYIVSCKFRSPHVGTSGTSKDNTEPLVGFATRLDTSTRPMLLLLLLLLLLLVLLLDHDPTTSRLQCYQTASQSTGKQDHCLLLLSSLLWNGFETTSAMMHDVRTPCLRVSTLCFFCRPCSAACSDSLRLDLCTERAKGIRQMQPARASSVPCLEPRVVCQTLQGVSSDRYRALSSQNFLSRSFYLISYFRSMTLASSFPQSSRHGHAGLSWKSSRTSRIRHPSGQSARA
jgi:hypothetical protein